MATPKPTPSPSANKPPSQEAQDAANTVPSGTTTGNLGLTGVPLGTEITVGVTGTTAPQFAGQQPSRAGIVTKKTQYTSESPTKAFNSMGAVERANTLMLLAQVPGLYEPGLAPTSQYLNSMGSNIAIRPEDVAALKKVMYYSDTVGEDFKTSLAKFYQNPGLATQYFQVKGQEKNISPSAALKAEIDAQFRDIFGSTATPKIAKAYIAEVNKGEAGAGLSQQQRQDIMLKYVQQAASELIAKVEKDPNAANLVQKGQFGQVYRQISQTYADNGIPTNDKNVFNKTVASLRGAQTLENTINDIQLQASTIFPAFKDLILKGKTAKELLTPYTNLRSAILETPEDQINIAEMANVAAGDKPLTPAEYKAMLYKDPSWKKTQNYQQTTLNDVQSMLSAFGIGK